MLLPMVRSRPGPFVVADAIGGSLENSKCDDVCSTSYKNLAVVKIVV